jgi:adenylate cyclase class 2
LTAAGAFLTVRSMSFEIEQKFRTRSHDEVAAKLSELGASAGPKVTQEDVYLRHPSRDFGATGEAFRLRRVGDRNALTYKGPRHAGPTKTREEIEIAFAPGALAAAEMLQLFQALGFRPVATIRKVRTPYQVTFRSRPLEVALDEAEDIGLFVEVESIVEGDDDLTEAQAAVQELGRFLGLTDVEPRSYLRMALERRAAESDE